MAKYQCYYNEIVNYNGKSYIAGRVNTECFETENEAEKYCKSHVGIQEYSDGSYEELEMNYEVLD